jgi:RNA polymerase sigma-70 factor (ECF subfamily)
MTASIEFTNQLLALLPKLRRFARTLTGSIDQGDDIVQSACERALERADQFVVGSRLDSWMYRIVQNVWIDRARHEALREEAMDPAELAGYPGEDALTLTENKIALAQTRRAIAKLPVELREVLVLVSIEELPYREAAAVLGIPIGTVMSRLSRARLTLYEKMAEPKGYRSKPFGRKR